MADEPKKENEVQTTNEAQTASDPVPQLNHAALMQGFFEGEGLKRMRK